MGKSSEENGFGSDVYICSEGKDTHLPVIKLVASLTRKGGALSLKYTPIKVCHNFAQIIDLFHYLIR